MTVAITRTKAEQGLTQNFEAVAAKLPGSPAVAEARRAAIGAFAALGLPHRRLEAWKYTDLRSHLKEALPAAVADAPSSLTRAELDAALEELADVAADRMVFVDGVYDRGLSQAGAVAGARLAPLAPSPPTPASEVDLNGTIPSQGTGRSLNRVLMD